MYATEIFISLYILFGMGFTLFVMDVVKDEHGELRAIDIVISASMGMIFPLTIILLIISIARDE